MKTLELAKDAARLTWKQRSLWWLGLFVAGAGSSSSSSSSGSSGASAAGGSAAAAAVSSVSGNNGIPNSVWFVVAALGMCLGLVALGMHLLSEGALIRGTAAARSGERLRSGAALRNGWASVGRVLGIKAMLVVFCLPAIAVMLGAGVLVWSQLLSFWVSVPIAVLVSLTSLLVMATLLLVSMYALRVGVLEDKGVLESWREARRFFSGRLLDSLLVFVVEQLSVFAFGIGAVVLAVPGLLFGFGTYFLTDAFLPALLVGMGLALPLVLPLMGALGTFRSSLWTVAFLDGRQEELA